jgi:hypothetical protein
VSEGVGAKRIETFLARLGREFHSAGRVYLVGDTALVHADLRHETPTIDLSFDVPPVRQGAFLRSVQRVSELMQVDVREESPAESVPLPAGAAGRARPVGRYGLLDVFYFDPYSIALAKIDQGGTEDMADVLALLHSGWVDMDRLTAYFEEILPRYEHGSLKGDPAAYRERFEQLEQRWAPVV